MLIPEIMACCIGLAFPHTRPDPDPCSPLASSAGPCILAALQRQILDKLREHEQGIDKEVEEIIGERRRCREVMVSGRHWCRGWRVQGLLAGGRREALPDSAMLQLHPPLITPPADLTQPRCHLCLPQEQAYQRMTGVKKAQWEKNNTFYTNRSFSREVRKVRLLWMGGGGLGGEADQCGEQQCSACLLATSHRTSNEPASNVSATCLPSDHSQ